MGKFPVELRGVRDLLFNVSFMLAAGVLRISVLSQMY